MLLAHSRNKSPPGEDGFCLTEHRRGQDTSTLRRQRHRHKKTHWSGFFLYKQPIHQDLSRRRCQLSSPTVGLSLRQDLGSSGLLTFGAGSSPGERPVLVAVGSGGAPLPPAH